LVPERREEITTEGGLDVVKSAKRLEVVLPRLFDAGIKEVALFVDPDPDPIRAAAASGANAVELHTGDFANAKSLSDIAFQVKRLAAAADTARECGLHLHAGHGLDYLNYRTFRGAVGAIDEVSIGFAIVARAVFGGLEQAVRDMNALVKGPIST
jgi:pyridoxine 5-phosphate synthase